MDKYFVFHHDGYAFKCFGLEEFNTEKEATDFITDRINNYDEEDNSISNYTVVKGKKLEIEPVEIIRKIVLV